MLLNSLNHLSLRSLRHSSHDFGRWRVVVSFAIALAVRQLIHLADQGVVLLRYLVGLGLILKIEYFEIFDFATCPRPRGLHLIQVVRVDLGLAREWLLPRFLQHVLVLIGSLAIPLGVTSEVV